MSSKQPQSRSGPDLPMPVPRAQSGREGRDRAGGPAQPRGAGAGSDPGLGRAGPVWADHGEHAKKAAEGWSPVSPSGGGDGGARASLKAALMGISRGIKLSCQCAWHHGSLGEDALRDPSLSRLPVSTSPRVSAPTKLKDGTQMWGSHQGTPAMPLPLLWRQRPTKGLHGCLLQRRPSPAGLLGSGHPGPPPAPPAPMVAGALPSLQRPLSRHQSSALFLQEGGEGLRKATEKANGKARMRNPHSWFHT